MLGRIFGRGADAEAGHVDAESVVGLLKVGAIKGVNLAIRDIGRRSSDPYVTLSYGNQEVKTRIMHHNCNPQWNEGLTLYATKSDITIRLVVFDHDTCSADDEMGEAEIDVKPYLKCYKGLNMAMMTSNMSRPQEGGLISMVQPTKKNCLARESCIVWGKGKLVQEMSLVLRNVECGEVDIEIEIRELPH
uniref:C2 domain-containing protein n=1 Tax=Kalanchoe fedtschenkoi TaxID=63787 RepID=A0A7N0UCN9_KALFE